MAWIVGDGFDYYSSTGDIARSVWDSVPNLPGINTGGRFAPSQCVGPQASGGDFGIKAIGSNESTLYVAVAFYRPGALSGTTPETYYAFRDGSTPQCTIVMESSGNIVLKRGDHTGTVLATYAGAFPQDIWNHFQCRVVFSATAGTFTVRKNGSVTDTFSATGLNTISTANAYATTVAWGHNTLINANDLTDDLLFFSGSGAAPNTWVGDVRAICLMPNADTAQKNFAPSPTAAATVTASCSGGRFGTSSWLANRVYYTGSITPARGGLVTQMVMDSLSGGVTGHMKAALYNNDGPGGTPGTLLAVSNEVVNPASGLVTFTFPAGTALSGGRTYYPAYLSDVAYTANATTPQAGSSAQTYASGFPSTAPSPTTAETYCAYATVTIAGNSCCVSERLANGDTDFVTSSTPGDYDLYDLDSVPVPVYAIIGVVSKVYLKKSDAGARQGQLALRSSTTDVFSPDSPLSSTYTYVSRVDTVDPATAAAWTLAGVNAVKVGVKLTS